MPYRQDIGFRRANGLYDRLRFVVRLKSEMQEALQNAQPTYRTNEAPHFLVESFATYLHETIHWWQHIGTTAGLILSFCSPAKTHINRSQIIKWLAENKPVKSLLDLNRFESHSLSKQHPSLNFILNNWHDLEFHLCRTLFPELIDEILSSAYFESLGHTIHIAMADTLWMLAATFDRNFQVVPDIRAWEDEFDDLRKRRVEGFYRGSPVVLPPVGTNAIFEAQARFSQLQYLYLATDAKLSWVELDKRGLLGEKYLEAFRLFLSTTNAPWPESPISSPVQLFLLLCDVALNPGDGYPFDFRHPESCVLINDPGIRFSYFCREIAKQPSLLTCIRRCDRQEYQELALRLCMTLACKTPTEISAEIVRWSSTLETLELLLQQEESFTFPNENLPIKLHFSKHLRLSQEKLTSPHFFCWPAMFLVEHDLWHVDLANANQVFARHLPLFVATIDGEIRIAPFQKVATPNLRQLFNDFYSWVIHYDLVDQWIARPGPFNLDFTDIHPIFTPEAIKPIAEKLFYESWGVALDDFIIVN